MARLSEKDFDQLALDGCDMVVYEDGSTLRYDVAGYDRIPRREMSPQQLSLRRTVATPMSPTPVQARFNDQPYIIRLGGFRRGQIFAPDEVGEKFRGLGIAFNDSLGNGIYESLLINRKYGLRQAFESPSKGFPFPYFEEEIANYSSQYEQYVDEFLTRFAELDSVYGERLIGEDVTMVIFALGDTPLGIFHRAYQRAPEALRTEMEKRFGISLPPINPQTPEDRLALSRFWKFIWAKHARILGIRVAAMRKKIGAGLMAIGNFHELPYMDQELLGSIYDYPAVAVRPLLLEDEFLIRHYTAYWTQLTYNLSGKPPMVSIRNTLSAAGSRFIPNDDLNRQWYDQAVRHGAGAFYLWTRDYPMDLHDPYDGPIIGNPAAETLPLVRWQANLSALGLLSVRQRFIPPTAQVGILVPLQSAWMNRQAWRRIYSTFSAAAEIKVQTHFLSDHQLELSDVPETIRLLLVPELEFLSTELRFALETFIQRGGMLCMHEKSIFDSQANPAAPIRNAQKLDNAVSNLFLLDQATTEADFQSAADEVDRLVVESGADPKSWIFDITCENLPPSSSTWLRKKNPSIEFRAWLYEHGSDWI